MQVEGVAAVSGLPSPAGRGPVPVVSDRSAHDQLPVRAAKADRARPLTREADRSTLEQVADGLNRTFEAVDKQLRFLVHEETERVYVRVIDRESGEVIREIPPEKLLDLIGRIQEMIGLLIDEWA
ncbi:MAG: flagellar protein FlaG [Firmicutes bacterium]|nr:flagellar protein FlaG [Bacillota bacterium]